ncbi:MAG: hypothetical protein AMJ56_13995 [Anaerolineae bacterium SG8_19]|jgi:uncharacterized membrane protein required for colicin V production|nr:MAG: hypothetical protein AMJ56_13995 [Anaerolineae bacterium SG8_19]
MINLFLLFWMLVVLFTVIGYMRGWQKEVIAMSGLVGAVAALMQFGYEMVSLFGVVPADVMTPEQLQDVRGRQILIQGIFFAIVAFFSYQVVASLAVSVAGGRFGERIRAGLERRIIGMLVGAINGYLVVGGLWSLLEYVPIPDGYEHLPVGVPYPFDPNIILRPAADTLAFGFTEWLPLGIMSPTLWLILFFVTFFIVIVALI